MKVKREREKGEENKFVYRVQRVSVDARGKEIVYRLEIREEIYKFFHLCKELLLMKENMR